MAGTGYGKSYIFETLALLGGPTKLVLVICPIKALEYDQVCAFMYTLLLLELTTVQAKQARAKGLKTSVVNEDTTETAGIWQQVLPRRVLHTGVLVWVVEA